MAPADSSPTCATRAARSIGFAVISNIAPSLSGRRRKRPAASRHRRDDRDFVAVGERMVLVDVLAVDGDAQDAGTEREDSVALGQIAEKIANGRAALHFACFLAA